MANLNQFAGMFMAQQKKLIACGTRLTLLGMFLRFVVGPAAMAAGGFAMGLRGDIFRIAIIQVIDSLSLSLSLSLKYAV